MKALILHGLIVLHFILMVLCFVGAWVVTYQPLVEPTELLHHTAAVSLVYGALLILLSRIYLAYKVGLYRISELVYSQTLSSLIATGLSWLLASILLVKLLNPLPLLLAVVVQTGISAAWSLLANKVFFTIHKAKKTAVIYREESDLRKLEEIRFFENRWDIQNKICWPEGNTHDLPVDGDAPEAHAKDIYWLIDKLGDGETVFVVGINATLRNGIVKHCIETGKDCYFVPHTGDVIISGAEHIKAFSVPILRARRANPKPEYLFVKRAFDILVSLAALVLLSPFMLATAIAIKLYDHGPAFYKQIRLTENGRRFAILKFRSMKVNAEKDGVARLASENDDRITPVGKFIRAVRFDELPQLINILKGDMTIVGPRPERPEIAAQYMQEMPAFSLRLQVRAGLTGYAQVYGRYNTEPADKLKMDLMYINSMSLFEDLRIMLATVKILLSKDSTSGVSEGQMTAVSAGNGEKSA